MFEKVFLMMGYTHLHLHVFDEITQTSNLFLFFITVIKYCFILFC